MRKLAVGTALTLVLFMSSCTCGLTRQNVANVDTSFGKLKVDYMDMCKKAGLSAAQIDDRQKFVDSVQHDIEALKASVK